MHAKGVRCKLYAVRHGRAHARAEQLGVAALVVRVEELGVRTDGPAHDDQDRRVPDSLRAVRNLCIRDGRAVRAAVSMAGLCMAHLHLRRHAVAHGERPKWEWPKWEWPKWEWPKWEWPKWENLCMAHLHLRRHAVAHGERPERHASGSVRRCAAT